MLKHIFWKTNMMASASLVSKVTLPSDTEYEVYSYFQYWFFSELRAYFWNIFSVINTWIPGLCSVSSHTSFCSTKGLFKSLNMECSPRVSLLWLGVPARPLNASEPGCVLQYYGFHTHNFLVTLSNAIVWIRCVTVVRWAGTTLWKKLYK